jgi:hypothetical protein
MANKERESTLKGRDAKTGQFIPVEEARNRPDTTVVERVPLPGKGKVKESQSSYPFLSTGILTISIVGTVESLGP